MSPDAPRIAVLLKGYPRLSETFIAQELLALERRGLPLELWSLRRPTDRSRHPMHAAIRAPITYLPEYLHRAPLRVLAGLAWALRRPRFGALLALFLRDMRRDPSANRLRRLGQALVLARELPDAVSHLHAHFLHTPASVGRYAALLTGRTWSFSAHAKDIWTTPDWELSEKLAQADWGVTCTRDGFRRLEALMPVADRESRPSHPDPHPEVPRKLSAFGPRRGPPACAEASGELLRGLRFAAASRDEGVGGIDADAARARLLLAYHGLDLTRFPDPPSSRPAREGADPADPLRLLCVGRLVAKKGHDDLIDALAALPTALHWHLSLIGGGERRAALEARVRAHGLAERVTFRGALAQPEVIAAMRAADLFVLPTKPAADGDRDGLPNVLMEAASQELPILATAFAGTPEFVTDGVHGVLVPPGEPVGLSAAIARLGRDPGTRRRLGRAARERLVRDFAMEAGIDLIAARLAASAGLAPSLMAGAPELSACAS